MNDIIMIVSGMIGTVGFGLFMNLKKTRLLYVALGSGLTCLFYIWMSHMSKNDFIIALVPTLITAIYCEILARVQKAPVTVFLIASLIPLIPGGSLYYTMHYILAGNQPMISYFGMQTIRTALALAVGIVAVSVAAAYFFDVYRGMKNK